MHRAGWLFLVYLFAGLVLDPGLAIAKGCIVRQDMDNDGRIDRIAYLDSSKNLLQLDADTNGDGRMDTFQYYEKGIVTRIERDIDADGHIDERDILKKGKIINRERLNVSGQIVGLMSFDDKGRLLKWQRDTTGDGHMDTLYHYKAGKACLIAQDTNGDGAFDVLVHMEQGRPRTREEDIDHDGRMDRFTEFDTKGRPKIIRELEASTRKLARISHFKDGRLISMEQFDQGRVVLTRFQDGKPVTQTIDQDRDGHPDEIVTYGPEGHITKVVYDTNHDGRIDTWQYYKYGKVIRLEQDRNHDKKVDAIVRYRNGREVHSLLDNDGDGYFETVTRFDNPGWTNVVEVRDKKGRPVERRFYLGGVLRKREAFDPRKGTLILVEKYDQKGRLTMSREAEGGSGRLSLIWHYDAQGNAVLGEKDSNGDGRVDVWYHYKNGHVIRVEEDRNHDGRPDLWETYNSAQQVVHRSEDVDFDGTVDIKK